MKIADTGVVGKVHKHVELVLVQRLVNHVVNGSLELHEITRQNVVGLLLGDRHPVFDRRSASRRCVAVPDGADVGRATVSRQLAAFKLLEKGIHALWAHLHGRTPSGRGK